MEVPEPQICYRALQSRDSRFDGLMFVGVTSTGVYCRPVCPARTPKFDHCRFYGSAAAAQEAGYRPCLRCRPETAPDMASWLGTSNTVSRAIALIADGALDGDEASIGKLCDRLGVGERHLRRLFLKHLGASPLSVAQTRRVLFAKQLIQETRMPMTDIAIAAGFGSVRRFNEVFHDLFHRPPSHLRREFSAGVVREDAAVTLRLRYRPPYDWGSMLSFLGARAISGVEVVEDGSYRRTVDIDGSRGTLCVFHMASRQSLGVTIRFADVRHLPAIITRVRRVFDTGADIQTIEDHLSQDPSVAALVAQRRGLRVPGAWDGFELAVRAILGQQIGVGAARKLCDELVARHGKRLPPGTTGHPGLSHVFPTPGDLCSLKKLPLPVTSAMNASLKALAEAAASDGAGLFRPYGAIDEAIGRFRSIRGIGEWTAQYIALRALREMDAFPASDAGLLRSASLIIGRKPSPGALLKRAESWRPWRGYAAQHLWASDSRIAPQVSNG